MAVNETVGIELVADTKSLRAQLKEATQELQRLQDSATASAEEIATAARKAADLRDRIGDAKQTIEAFNPDAKFKAFGNVVQGVAGAFAAMQGALALVGVESEDVQKTLLKVQAALALSQGLNAVLDLKDAWKDLALQVATSSTAIKINNAVIIAASRIMKIFGQEVVVTSTSFKFLKAAITATGVGLLIIALTEAVAAFQNLVNATQEATEAQEEFNKKSAETEDKVRNAEKAYIEYQTKKLLLEAKSRKESLEEIFKIEDQGRRLEIKSQQRLIKEKKALNQSTIEDEQELKQLERERELAFLQFKIDQQDKANEKINDNKQKSNEKGKQIDNQKAKDDEERAQRELDLALERARRILEIGKIGSTEYEQKIADLEEQYNEDIALFEGNEKTKLFITKKFEEEKFKIWKQYRGIISEEEEKEIDKRLEKLDKEREAEISQREKTNSLIMKAMDKSLAVYVANKEKENEFAKISEETKLSIISNAVGAAANLIGRNTLAGKALSIAQATIDTYAGATKALAAYPPPFGAIAAGTVIAGGLANVSAIINTEVPQFGDSAGISMPSVGRQAPVQPQFLPPVPTKLDQTSLNSIQNVVARAYVVESDITGSQKRISRIQNAARI